MALHLASPIVLPLGFLYFDPLRSTPETRKINEIPLRIFLFCKKPRKGLHRMRLYSAYSSPG